MSVFVLDKNKKPLMPCSEKRARQLLQRKRAVVHKIEPFTIRLKDRKQEHSTLQSLRLKLDPGSKTTGVAIVKELPKTVDKVVTLGEIHHKKGISESLKSRRDSRRGRRNRKTRYRKCRFGNRKIKKGWLAPSLVARINQIINFTKKIQKLTPIQAISQELVKFDTQKMENPEISGMEYQQGTLEGYEVREYLLEKFNRTCAYCGATDVPLEIEHVVAKSRGGSNRISNLAIACRPCNEAKGNLLIEEWKEKLQKSKKKINQIRLLNLQKVVKQLKQPLKDAATMNSTRWYLFEQLKNIGLPIESGSGARTKMQRIQHQLHKEHYFDALCVGESTPKYLLNKLSYVQEFHSIGRGNRKMARVDKYGFPLNHLDKEKYNKNGERKGHRSRKKTFKGFQTGDIAISNVTNGKKKGFYRGHITIRHSGHFDIKDIITNKKVEGLSFKYFKVLQRNNGWHYQKKKIS